MESIEKHTPGPWSYVRDDDYWEIQPTNIGGKDNMEGNEADYRLIAAAPDLLKLARAVRRLHSYSGEDADGFAKYVDDLARDTLAKVDEANG